jgi:uncharacterized protein involved in high-affinity Fe2+ transport
MKVLVSCFTFALVIISNVVGAATFKEYPIGEAVELNGMKIAAVYLPPIKMEMTGAGLAAGQADVHLEADIHALKGNNNGFGAGEWIPYLSVQFKLENLDNGKSQSGTFMPMVAVDGPHYGDNVKMMGPGNYKVTFTIDNPTKQGMHRHIDPETGVGKWFNKFDVSYNFKFVPLK